MTPFFQTSHRSLAYQFTVNAPLLCPMFSIFKKILHFQPCFGQNSSSLDQNFSKFSFLRPLFCKENPLPRPYILKPAWHISTKKKVECPPRGPDLCFLKEQLDFQKYTESVDIFLQIKYQPNIHQRQWYDMRSHDCNFYRNQTLGRRIDHLFVFFWTSEIEYFDN